MRIIMKRLVGLLKSDWTFFVLVFLVLGLLGRFGRSSMINARTTNVSNEPAPIKAESKSAGQPLSQYVEKGETPNVETFSETAPMNSQPQVTDAAVLIKTIPYNVELRLHNDSESLLDAPEIINVSDNSKFRVDLSVPQSNLKLR